MSTSRTGKPRIACHVQRMILIHISLVCVFLAGFPMGSASQETTGTLEGRLVDESGDPISMANVQVTGSRLQGSRSVISDTDGYFSMFMLPIGIYSLTILHTDYQELSYENVTIQLGRTTPLGEIRLVDKAADMDRMIVTTKKKWIDPTSTAIGTNLSADEFHDLPIDRNYMNIPTILPHVNESFFGDGVNFGGSTGLENKFFIDGVETTDPVIGMTGMNLPYNFINEIQVKTGGYEAEYRSSLGGIVNVVSRSGGNELSGHAFGFFLNNQLAGTPRKSFNDPVTGDFAQFDLGLSLGGPIKRDRLWFFAAYNPQFRNEDVEIPGQGFHEDKSTAHIFSGKLDWRAGANTKVALHVIGDPTTREGVAAAEAETYAAPDPLLYDATTGGVNVLANATHFIGESFFLEVPVSYITRKDRTVGATEAGKNEGHFIDFETGVASGGFGQGHDIDTYQLTVEAKGTLSLGSHTLKSGVAYRDRGVAYRENWKYLYRYSDSLYTQVLFTATDGTVRNRIPSVYAQDSWRVSDRLRLNAGIRWDAQFLIATDGSVAQKITDQFQPRIGFVYQPGEIGSQKVFGSFGRFYQELSMILPIFQFNEYQSGEFTDYYEDPRVNPSAIVDQTVDPGVISPEVEDLKGQHFDEFNLGYERRLGKNFTIGAIGTYRTLRQGIDDGYVPALDEYRFGNPGQGDLADYPKAKREYEGLELLLQVFGEKRYNARLSYVLSRTHGNYPGLFDSEYFNYAWPNNNASFDLPEMLENGDGLLANDRTHVFKLSGAYAFPFGLSAGTTFSWQSGTPLSVLEAASLGFPWMNFAQERGSAGRTPSIWDLNLRFTYDLSRALNLRTYPRLVLDIFHLGSQRKPVGYDELTYFNQDNAGNQIDPNPTYGFATLYQPPTTVRLGVEMDF